MTRKKFVKQLMGRGLSRTGAQRYVAMRPAGISYADYYKEILWRVELAAMGERLKRKFKRGIKAIKTAITHAPGRWRP